jgi:hypothetical protein
MSSNGLAVLLLRQHERLARALKTWRPVTEAAVLAVYAQTMP